MNHLEYCVYFFQLLSLVPTRLAINLSTRFYLLTRINYSYLCAIDFVKLTSTNKGENLVSIPQFNDYISKNIDDRIRDKYRRLTKIVKLTKRCHYIYSQTRMLRNAVVAHIDWGYEFNEADLIALDDAMSYMHSLKHLISHVSLYKYESKVPEIYFRNCFSMNDLQKCDIVDYLSSHLSSLGVLDLPEKSRSEWELIKDSLTTCEKSTFDAYRKYNGKSIIFDVWESGL